MRLNEQYTKNKTNCYENIVVVVVVAVVVEKLYIVVVVMMVVVVLKSALTSSKRMQPFFSDFSFLCSDFPFVGFFAHLNATITEIAKKGDCTFHENKISLY